MGERSNIVIVNDAEAPGEPQRVWLYGHWMGEDSIGHAAHGLRSGRVSDGAYLTRIIFSSMVAHDIRGETGFGISTTMVDNGYPIIVINPTSEGTPVWIEDERGTILASPVPAKKFVEVVDSLEANDFDELILGMRES